MRNRRAINAIVIAIVSPLFAVAASSITASADEPEPTDIDHIPTRLVDGTPGRTETWAVTIGIDDYATGPDLQVAVDDAVAVDRFLTRRHIPDDHRLLLLDDRATADAIRGAFERIVAVAGPEDHVVITVAAHAVTDGSGRHALRSADGLLLHDTELARILQPLDAATWIVMATCYGAGFDELLGPNRLLTAAADQQAESYENTELGHSYLIEYLFERQLAAADNQGVDIASAFDRAAAAIAAEHPERVPMRLGESIDLQTEAQLGDV